MLRALSPALLRGLSLLVACGSLAVGCNKKKEEKLDTPIVSSVAQPTLNLFGFEESYIHRINFNVQQRGRLILVKYDPKHPGEVEIVDCAVNTRYAYQASDAKGVETLFIRNEGELNAQVPMGLLRFGGYLKAGSQLEFQYATIGSYQVSDEPVVPRDRGKCNDATHYVASLSVGAFSFVEHRGGEGGVNAGTVAGPKVEVRAARERGATRAWGDMQACDRDDPKGCRTPTQMLLWPLPAPGEPVPAMVETTAASEPAPTTDAPVEGAKIRLTIDEAAWRPGHHMALALEKALSFAQYFEGSTTFGFDMGSSPILGGYLDGAGLSIVRPLLAGNQYVVFGTSSSDQDIDLEIQDSTGKTVALDNDDDAQPLVSFSPPADGQYTIMIGLGKPKSEAFAAVGIMVDKGGARMDAEVLQRVYQGLLDSGRDAHDQVRKLWGAQGIGFHEANREWALFGTFLEPKTQNTTSGTHLAGPSVIVSRAHDESIDLDVIVRDANGREWSDTEKDARPVVVIKDPVPGAAHDIRVVNPGSGRTTLAASLILTAQ